MDHLKDRYTYEEWDAPPPSWFLGFVMFYHPFVVVGTHVMYSRFFKDTRDKNRYKNSVRAFNSIIEQHGWRGLYRGAVPTFMLFLYQFHL